MVVGKPTASPHQPHLIHPEIIKGLKFKHWSHDRQHTQQTPSVALTIVDAFAKFKERGFIPKTTTWPRPHPFWRKFFTLGTGLAVVDPLAKF